MGILEIKLDAIRRLCLEAISRVLAEKLSDYRGNKDLSPVGFLSELVDDFVARVKRLYRRRGEEFARIGIGEDDHRTVTT